MKYEAIESHSSEFSVRKMCKVLELDVSNYYRWKRNQEKRDGKLLKEKQLIKKIEDIFENSDRTYGYRVIKEELKQIGEEVSEYKVRRIMRENGITGSMSKGGCPYDNSCVESFFATLKKERIYRRDYVTIEDVKRDMFRYIELFYNRKRLHSILGYMSPVAYRLKYDRENVA